MQSIPANTSQTLCGRRHTHSFCIRLSGIASQARLDGITPTLRATGGPLWVVWQTPSGERLLSRGLHPYERLALQGFAPEIAVGMSMAAVAKAGAMPRALGVEGRHGWRHRTFVVEGFERLSWHCKKGSPGHSWHA